MKRVCLVFFLVVGMLIITACSPRDPLTAEEFVLRMEAEGYDVQDATMFLQDIPGLEAIIIVDSDDIYIEFSLWDTEADARRAFTGARRDFEDASGRTRSYRSQDMANFNRFQQTTDGRFEAVTRVENTVLIIETTAEHRNLADAVLEALGY